MTNFGLNTKYHPSPEKPALLYYGDLDGTGKKRIIEAEFEGSVCYPIRGKSCSTRTVDPVAGEKVPELQRFRARGTRRNLRPGPARRGPQSSKRRSCAVASY